MVLTSLLGGLLELLLTLFRFILENCDTFIKKLLPDSLRDNVFLVALLHIITVTLFLALLIAVVKLLN